MHFYTQKQKIVLTAHLNLIMRNKSLFVETKPILKCGVRGDKTAPMSEISNLSYVLDTIVGFYLFYLRSYGMINYCRIWVGGKLISHKSAPKFEVCQIHKQGIPIEIFDKLITKLVHC